MERTHAGAEECVRRKEWQQCDVRNWLRPHSPRLLQCSGWGGSRRVRNKEVKGRVDFSKISEVHFLSKTDVGNSEEVRTNLNIKFQRCTKTGGKPKFISVLLFFFTLVELGKPKSPQKSYRSYSETEMTEKTHEKI